MEKELFIIIVACLIGMVVAKMVRRCLDKIWK